MVVEEGIAGTSQVDNFSSISSDSGSKATLPKRKKLNKEGPLGVRKGRPVTGSNRMYRENDKELLIEHDGDMTQDIRSILKK